MIGIDVGGANLKVVDDEGVCVHYCPLWKQAPIGEILAAHSSGHDNEAAVVMSGELADCFSSKAEGIAFIVKAVRSVYPKARFYGTDGTFHAGPAPSLAAANWLASADWLRVTYPGAVLVDMGSTTTDIVPAVGFRDLTGLTDLLRLQKGLLIYTGLLRTNLATALQSVRIHGVLTRTSAEFFAQSADAHLLLGHIGGGEYTCDTPDNGGKDRDGAARRIARVVCADPDEIGETGIMEIAQAFWGIQLGQISGEVGRASARYDAGDLLTAGIGSRLLTKAIGGTDLSRKLGPAADALPAFAVREVALRNPSRFR